MKFILIVVAVALNLQCIIAQKSGNPSRPPFVIESVVFVDMEFVSLFKNDKEMEDYLTVFFWDVNSRFKSIPNVDISLTIVDLIKLKSKEEQPFIEKARRPDTQKTYYKDISNNFQTWLYEKQGTAYLMPNDLAILLTNSDSVNDTGIATLGGLCRLSDGDKKDIGTAVFYNRGNYMGIGVAAHEIGHSLGADHDFENDRISVTDCPKGYLMAPVIGNGQYFFSKCSNDAIFKNINSVYGSCLQTSVGNRKTKIDPNFSLPKAGTMEEVCRRRFGPTASVKQEDIGNCAKIKCQYQNKDNKAEYMDSEPVENVQCLNGRCFRGTCRPEGKLLRHEASGNCLKAISGFGLSDSAKMVVCPATQDKTPFNTLAIIDVTDGKILSSPYLDKDNSESGDKCFYSLKDATTMWTEKCKPTNTGPFQTWNFVPVNGNTNTFQLVNKVSGKCAKPTSKADGSAVQLVTCTADSDMIWTLL